MADLPSMRPKSPVQYSPISTRSNAKVLRPREQKHEPIHGQTFQTAELIALTSVPEPLAFQAGSHFYTFHRYEVHSRTRQLRSRELPDQMRDLPELEIGVEAQELH